MKARTVGRQKNRRNLRKEETEEFEGEEGVGQKSEKKQVRNTRMGRWIMVKMWNLERGKRGEETE